MEKPSFDPNQPFQSVEDQKPEFDPNQSFQPIEIPKQDSSSKPSFDESKPFQDIHEKYSTPGQQALNMAEGALRGVSVGASTLGEQKLSELGIPGLTDEDIKNRQLANPGGTLGSEVAGNVALSFLLPEVKIAQLGKVGAAAIKSAISSGLFQSGDEISNSLLGQGNPASSAAAHIAGMTGLGLLTGAGVSKGLQKLESVKAGTAVKSFITGMGYAANNNEFSSLKGAITSELPEGAEGLSKKAFLLGQGIYKAKLGAIPAAAGYILNDASGAGIGGLVGYHFSKAIEPYISKASEKYAAPMLMKMAASGSIDGVSKVLDSAACIAKGNMAIEKGIEGLFSSGSQKVFDAATSERDIEKLKEHIENGEENNQLQQMQAQQIHQQHIRFAEGGKVSNITDINQPDPMAEHFPEHSMMVTTAKSRLVNYLNSVRPLPASSPFPFDKNHKDKQKERDYNKVLKLANQPLAILNHIKDGSLLPKHVAAINAMYPELHQELSKKITAGILKHQLDDTKKPPYKVRQAMSLFMGTSLDSTLTPIGIQAAQNVFVQQRAQRQAPQKSTNSLGKSGQNLMTDDQARERRLNKN